MQCLQPLPELASEKPTFSTAAPTTEAEALSLLYTLLPRILQKHVPKLPSLRHTASTYATPKPHIRASSTSSSGSDTPPPSYRTRPSTPLLSIPATSETDDEEPDSLSCPSSSHSEAFPSFHALGGGFEQRKSDGIASPSAQHGLTLLRLAAHESANSALTERNLARRLYVDGVGYLLRGLPDILTEEEVVVLRAALPAHFCTLTSTSATKRDLYRQHEAPTLLHRAAAAATLQALLLLSTLLPYLYTLSLTLRAFDSKHRVTERAYGEMVVLVQVFWAQVVGVVAVVWGWNEGQLRRVGMGVVRDLSRGVGEGVGRAVEVIGEGR